MNIKKNNLQEILFGILTAIGLWIFGHLLSGRLFFVENIELYPTGYLVFIFPFVFALTCILVAKYAAKNKKRLYLKTSLVYFVMPAVCFGGSALLETIISLAYKANLIWLCDILGYFVIVMILPSVAMLSVFGQMLHCFGSGNDGIKLVILIIINIIPMLAGIIAAFKIYNNSLKTNK